MYKRQLLKVTSIPIPQTLETRVNGTGVLNSYKLFRLGLKLKVSSFKESAIKEGLLELNLEAESLLKTKSTSLEDKILNLRKAFLIGTPNTQKIAATKLSKLLSDNDQNIANVFYSNFSKSFQFTETEVSNIPVADSFSYTRFWIDTKKPSNQDIKNTFNDLDINSKFAVLAEFSQSQTEKSFLESLTQSSEKNDAFRGMTLGEWAKYLIGKFYK